MTGERVPDYRDTVPRVTTTPVIDSGRAKKYSPWRMLVPRYWLPQVDEGIDGGYRVGALTSGSDIVGRHTYTADFEIPTNNRGGVVASASYQYSGLGLPIIQADASQEWESLGGIVDRTPEQHLIGEAFRRTWSADLLATLLRQRYRTSVSLTGGVGVEHRTHVTTPANLISSIDTSGAFGSPTFPSLIAAASFANYQRPAFSISPEDGILLSATVRDRLRSGAAGRGSQSLSTVAAAALYKSFDLPGFAHHVLALRGAGGYADERASGYFAVGGVSGNTFQIIPGYVIGEGRKTFPVRGFSSGTLLGIRAFTGSAEYRVPLLIAGGTPGPLPFFLDRSSLTVFADYGSAWCPNLRADREVCNTSTRILRQHLSIASAGAELNLNLGVLTWDSPYRFRLGVAKPTYNGAYLGQASIKAYVVSGVSF